MNNRNKKIKIKIIHQNYNKTPKFMILKKQLLLKPLKNSGSASFDLIHQENTSNDDSQITISTNYDKVNNNPIKKINIKKVNLPSLSYNYSCFKTILDSNKKKDSLEKSPNNGKKMIRLKKIKIKNNEERYSSFINNTNKNLINLYQEDLKMKKKFERYKVKKLNNLKNFSFQKYNMNLLKYSSIDLSQDSYQIFVKNMKEIDYEMNGIRVRRNNRWANFLKKIENFAPLGLKKKLISLAFSKNKNKEEEKRRKSIVFSL